MSNTKGIVLGLLLGFLAVPAVHAAPASWTDWQSNPSANTIVGNLNIEGEDVTVTFQGAFSFVQFGNAGETNYWIPSAPYTSAAVDNAPATTDIIALNTGGEFSVTFSRPVVDPLIALVSWNGNVVEFDSPIEFLSFGAGFWGNGTPVNITPTGFTGSGEVHGVARIIGAQDTFRVSHTSENWHGFTVGAFGVADSTPLPSPAPLALLGVGLTALALTRRARR